TLRKVMKDKKFAKLAEVFCKDSTKEKVMEAGERALVSLYNGKDGESIDKLRVRRFREKVAKSSKYVEAKSLPPTKAATKFHSFRVHFQVHEWKGQNRLKADDWGWKLKDGKLKCIKTELPAGPEKLLSMIRCQCTSGCSSARCSCRKHGIVCSYLYGECKGIHCTNSPQPDFEDNADDD
ncbi:MAG: hypothetical protein MJA29_13210, partial [Candidatus Omnitrophica bacterium]|nr:hypothetical protein [Candidatus Omnitrophota bacterium]